LLQDLAKSFKALDMPDLSRKFVPKHDAGKLTEPAPFSLSTDRRHAIKEAELKAKQQAEEQKLQEARRYKANPIRSPSALTSLGIGAVKQRPLTEPKPFALQSEAKHEHFAAQWSARVEQEREDERSKFSSFHARPVPKTVTDSDRVFTPRRSGKPLTEVHDVHLNVDRRIQKHQELSQRKAEREKRLEAERMAEEERRKEEEAREVRNMRRSMVIKAKAVPSSVRHGATSVVHSSKPLTEPISPNFRCLFVNAHLPYAVLPFLSLQSQQLLFVASIDSAGPAVRVWQRLLSRLTCTLRHCRTDTRLRSART
jgi:hypothetical protein